MNTSRVMSSLSGRSHMILYAVRDTMVIYLSMITFKASRHPRTTSRIKDASLACPILICPFIKFIQGALFKNNSEHAPSDSKKQNATFLPARAAVLSSDTPFSAKSPVSRTGNCHSATIPCSDTPFQEEKPVSRQPDTGKAEAQCSHTPFSAKFRVSRKGNRKPLPTHKNTRRPTKKCLQESGTIDADTFISGT